MHTGIGVHYPPSNMDTIIELVSTTIQAYKLHSHIRTVEPLRHLIDLNKVERSVHIIGAKDACSQTAHTVHHIITAFARKSITPALLHFCERSQKHRVVFLSLRVLASERELCTRIVQKRFSTIC